MSPADATDFRRLLSNRTSESESAVASLSSTARNLLDSSLLALGTSDAQGRPWTAVWGGENGFTRQMAPSFVGVKVRVDHRYDPVVEALLGVEARTGEVDFKSSNAMVSAIAINTQEHRFLKFSGTMVAGSITTFGNGNGEIKMLLHLLQEPGSPLTPFVDSTPELFNNIAIAVNPTPSSGAPCVLPLCNEAIALLARSGTFFASFSSGNSDLITNCRAGSAPFIKILSNDERTCVLAYPDYPESGFYHMLGNLMTRPRAGLVVPDLETGDVLYLTARAEFHVGEEAASLFDGTNLAVRLTVLEARFVRNGLGFRTTSETAWSSVSSMSSPGADMNHEMS